MSVCSTFRRLAFETWDILASSRTVEYQPGEETLTDLNILELKKRHPTEVFTRTFSKPEEGKNGADWEWWLTGSSGQWFAFRLQAKILNLETDEFEHLHYKSSKNSSFQCDQLIRSALRSKVPLVPLYCLYSNWVSGLNVPLFPCGTFGISLDSFGCSLVSAFDIRQLRLAGNVRDLKSVIRQAFPWHCLVCCTGYGDGDLPHRAHRFWQAAIRLREITPQADAFDEAGLQGNEFSELLRIYEGLSPVNEPPTHVTQLLLGELVPALDQSLGGIVVVREMGETGA